MSREDVTYVVALLDLVCWLGCFACMFALSKKQNKMLDEIRDQGRRIEELSKKEHDLIQEVHPQVKDIKADVANMNSKVDQLSP
jgi:septal ring factor EnvC (AmiA/AmiB activator)